MYMKFAGFNVAAKLMAIYSDVIAKMTNYTRLGLKNIRDPRYIIFRFIAATLSLVILRKIDDVQVSGGSHERRVAMKPAHLVGVNR